MADTVLSERVNERVEVHANVPGETVERYARTSAPRLPMTANRLAGVLVGLFVLLHHDAPSVLAAEDSETAEASAREEEQLFENLQPPMPAHLLAKWQAGAAAYEQFQRDFHRGGGGMTPTAKAALLEAYHTAEERLRRKAFELAVTKFEVDNDALQSGLHAYVQKPPQPKITEKARPTQAMAKPVEPPPEDFDEICLQDVDLEGPGDVEPEEEE